MLRTMLIALTAALIGAAATEQTGPLEQRRFDGTLTWDLLVNDGSRFMHHDIEPMPNGNVLVIV